MQLAEDILLVRKLFIEPCDPVVWAGVNTLNVFFMHSTTAVAEFRSYIISY